MEDPQLWPGPQAGFTVEETDMLKTTLNSSFYGFERHTIPGNFSDAEQSNFVHNVRNLVKRALKFYQNSLEDKSKAAEFVAESKAASDSLVARKYAQLGHLQLILNDFEKAYLSYEHVIAVRPPLDPYFWYGLGICAFYYGWWKKVDAILNFVLKIAPNFIRKGDALVRLGIASKNERHYEDALSYFNEAFTVPGQHRQTLTDSEIKFHIADTLLLQHKYGDAKRIYESLENSPDHVTNFSATMHLGLLYSEFNSFESAVHKFREAVSKDQRDYRAWYNLGRCFAEKQRFHEAFDALNKAIQMDGSSADCWLSIGVLYHRHHQGTYAFDMYRRALQYNRKCYQAWANLGTLYLSTDQLMEAENAYKHALQHSSGSTKQQILMQLQQTQQLQQTSHPHRSMRTNLYPAVEIDDDHHEGGHGGHGHQDMAMPGLAQQQHADKGMRAQHDGQLLVQEPALAPVPRPYDAMGYMHPYAPSYGPYVSISPYPPHGVQRPPVVYSNQPDIRLPSMKKRGRKPRVERDDFPEPKRAKLAPASEPANADDAKPPAHAEGPAVARAEVEGAVEESTIEGAVEVAAAAHADAEGVGHLSDESAAVAKEGDPKQQASGVESDSIDVQRAEVVDMQISSAIEAESPGVAEAAFDSTRSAAIFRGILQAVGIDMKVYATPTIVAVAPTLRIDTRTQRTDDTAPGSWACPSEPGQTTLSAYCRYQAYYAKNYEEDIGANVGACAPPPPRNAPSGDTTHVQDAQMDNSLLTTMAPHAHTDLEHNTSTDSAANISESSETAPRFITDQRDASADLLGEDRGSHETSQAAARRNLQKFIPSGPFAGCTPMSAIETAKYVSTKKLRHRKLFSRADNVKFATNIDITDRVRWEAQWREIEKLPAYMRIGNVCDALSYLGGKPVLGVNTVQIYAKVPGCKTPGHQENNSLCSINFSVGPGDCEWFVVHNRHWQKMKNLLDRRHLDFMTSSWWPVAEELRADGIPVESFIQHSGDLVWISPGTVHWVRSLGVCNNVSWNVSPLIANQYMASCERADANDVEKFHSLVPMASLSYNLAQNAPMLSGDLALSISQHLDALVRRNEEELAELQAMGVAEPALREPTPDEPTAYHCCACQVEIFNIIYARPTQAGGSYEVYCAQCARNGATSALSRAHGKARQGGKNKGVHHKSEQATSLPGDVVVCMRRTHEDLTAAAKFFALRARILRGYEDDPKLMEETAPTRLQDAPLLLPRCATRP